jgi:hypothetical protein
MSQDLQMTISARDNASRVVEGVEKRVKTFGVQFGQQLAGMLAPMALVGMAIGKIGAKIEEIRQKRKDAFDWGASLQASANKMGVTVEAFQAVEAAADATDLSVEKVGKSFKMASDLIAAAKEGNLEAADALSALGVNLTNLEKTTPQDVLRRLAAALATTEDPAKRAQLAIAALGKEAGALQDVLAKGFDIAGAIEGTEGLTSAEAAFLRQQAREERARQNRERLISARQQATQRFLEEDPQGRAILAAEQERLRRLAGPAAGQAALGGFGLTAGVASADPRIQAQVLESLERARKAAEQASKPTPDAAAAAALAARADEDAKKAAQAADKESKKKPKEIKSKTSPLEFTEASQPTVSSLRAIGGGMAGEVAGLVDFQRNSLEVQKQIRDILAEIKAKGNIMNTDFTKPASGPSNGGYVPPITLPNRPSLTGSTGTMLA